MPPYSSLSKKNSYQFNIGSQHHLTISSNFDGGNISLIKQVNQFQYRLQSMADQYGSKGKKSWFYFSVKVEKQVKVRFCIQNVSIYESMYQQQNWPKPVYRIGLTGKWSAIKSSYLIYRDEVNLIIDHQFTSQQPVYFALAIPFTYYEMQNYLHDLQFTVPEMIDFKDQIIKQTKTGRNLHLLTFQDKQLKQYKDQSGNKRSIILVTSRVHPGQVSSSYCLMGMLQFILKPFCLQSQILRKMFTFIIIPMVNPDGVYEGNYRMDLNGQNLNRVYLQPDPVKHETVYAIKSHFQDRMKNGDKIIFHFDLHAHSGMRRSFIYGNAFDDIIQQTETQLFCKILDRNCPCFQQNLCQFGQKHMKFKDRGEMMSKQGCARVVLSKMASTTYSYTIQSSIFPVQQKNYLLEKNDKPLSTNLNFKISNQEQDNLPYAYDNFQQLTNKYLSEPNIIDQNKNLGIKIMLSILDMMMKNPYSSLNEKDLDQMRKQIAGRILQSQERFKMLDTKAYHKSKFISHFAKNQFQSKFKYEWAWLAQCPQFQNIEWPNGFEWFKKQIIKEKVKKIPKLKTQCRQQRIYTRAQNQPLYLKQLPQKAVSNRLIIKTQASQSDQFRTYSRLPMIQKSLQTKKIRNQEKLSQSPQKKLQKTQNIKISKNILSTNRSNILLTFLEDVEEKREQRIISKKRILSLKMASINRNSAQKAALDDRINEIIFESLDSDFAGLKPSHSQGQLPISIFGESQKYTAQQGYEFEDKLLIKNYEVKKSRKQLISRKISMLKKANENKKQANKNSLMKFPQIGKAFLVTNAKKRIEKVKKSADKLENDQKSTIQNHQKIFMNDFLQPEVNSIVKLKTQTSVSQ